MTITGRLDRRVQFLRASAVDDGFQNKPGTYLPYGGKVWAAKRDVPDSEKFAAGTLTAGIAARFQVRYSGHAASITEADRLSCEGRTYAIVRIKELGRRVGLEITCQRVEHG